MERDQTSSVIYFVVMKSAPYICSNIFCLYVPAEFGVKAGFWLPLSDVSRVATVQMALQCVCWRVCVWPVLVAANVLFLEFSIMDCCAGLLNQINLFKV